MAIDSIINRRFFNWPPYDTVGACADYYRLSISQCWKLEYTGAIGTNAATRSYSQCDGSECCVVPIRVCIVDNNDYSKRKTWSIIVPPALGNTSCPKEGIDGNCTIRMCETVVDAAPINVKKDENGNISEKK